MISPSSARTRLALAVLPAVLAAAAGGAVAAPRVPRVPRGNPTLVLESAAGERTLPVSDLRFVYYERIFYHKRAPRSEEAKGERVDVEDRRRECRCLRLQDWSALKFSKLRQIEILYPPAGAGAVAVLRVTQLDGKMNEMRADALSGALDSFAPRFSAGVDGEVREFPLILTESEASWPEERLVRLLLKRPPKPPATRRNRR